MFVHHRKQEVVSTVEEKTAEEENFPELKDIDMIMTDETLRTLKVILGVVYLKFTCTYT